MIVRRKVSFRKRSTLGFTLAEVVTSLGILAVVIQGVILGYVASAQRAEWSAHSLAAQSIATQGAEQARSARWDTKMWPQTVGAGQPDELGTGSFTRTATLDIPVKGQPIVVTNYITITSISTNPAIRQIKSDCVWKFMSRGWFTNTTVVLRAPDQ